MYSTEIEEFAKCVSDPIYFIEKYLKLRDLYNNEQSFKLFDFQKELINSYLRNKTNVLSTNGMGITSLTAAFVFWNTIFHSNQVVCLVSENTVNVRKLYDLTKKFYDNPPDYLKPKLIKDTLTHTTYSNQSHIIIKELQKFRGMTPSLIVAETREFEQLNMLIKPMMNISSSKSIVIKL